MNVPNTDHLNTYITKLPVASPAEAIALLRKIEEVGKDIPGTGEKLIPLLHHRDYLVLSRVFIALNRIKDPQVSGPLLDYLDTRPGEEWELRVLECLYYLNDQRVIPRVSSLLDWHDAPLLIRGAVWLLGYLGGEEALEILLEFAVHPKSRIVKSEVILEAIALAIKSLPAGPEYGEEIIRRDPVLTRYFRYSRLPEVDPPRFFVYPYPDYLLDQAKARGIKAKEFKKLYYREREI